MFSFRFFDCRKISLIKNLNNTTYRYNSKKTNNFEYCMNSVKTNDYNAYIETIIAPQKIMRASFAVKAFNIELLSIGKAPSNESKKISEMKLLFWKDQIDKIFLLTTDENQKPLKLNEPVSNELLQVIKLHNLSKVWFNRMIEGRKHFFSVQQFKSMDELEKCGDASMTSAFYLMFTCMGIKNVDSDHAASHLGKAQMICGVVRNILRKSSQSVYYLPSDLLLKHKISQQDLISFNERILRSKHQNLKDLAFELCTRAKQHVNSSRDLMSKMPKEARVVLAPNIALDIFLNRMEAYDFDLMNQKLKNDAKTKFLLKIMMAKLTNSY